MTSKNNYIVNCQKVGKKVNRDPSLDIYEHDPVHKLFNLVYLKGI